ncbi:hypothetical protein EIP91_007488 [Steccherinum ochraceum]|uniref:Uncharacterized protein n=1 Tax=Steccherinum ochraceum TaxID=92696 RepID=A0A4R0RER1_9APHY|nr:hypothetical protein EIP91_007488 [Steccherinum ochraceum]
MTANRHHPNAQVSKVDIRLEMLKPTRRDLDRRLASNTREITPDHPSHPSQHYSVLPVYRSRPHSFTDSVADD